jgi:diacylglycerol O-acyltransferase / wax synthase
VTTERVVGSPVVDSQVPPTQSGWAGAAGRTCQNRAEVPLVEWGTLALRAGRRRTRRMGNALPHMGWLLRFPEPIDPEAIEAEAQRMASNPYGLGRRIAHARLPGGRPRWRPSPAAPRVVFSSSVLGEGDELGSWIDAQLSVRLDPEYDTGWHVAATHTDAGDTVLLVVVHHLFGIARGLVGAIYAGDSEDLTFGTTGLRFDDPANDYTLRAELHGLRERFTLGFRGLSPSRLRTMAGEAAEVRRQATTRLDGYAAIQPPRGRDRTRLPLSDHRVAAFAFMPAQTWDETAATWGGTANTLITAVTANLLRRARQARGGPSARPLQLVLPIDLTRRQDVDRSARMGAGVSAEMTMTTAKLVLPGGAPARGDLRETRARMRAALAADAATAPTIRGVPDVARLLPERVTLYAAYRAAVSFDGCVSNVGELPPAMLRLGPHHASHVVMLGFPIGNEALVGLLRCRDQLSISVVTDPTRLGRDADLRNWLAEELAGWGLRNVVM